VLLGGRVACLAVPCFALAAPTCGLSLIVGSVVIAVTGIGASVFGVYKSLKLKKYVDWTDYSDKMTVFQDIDRLSNLNLRILAEHSQSPIYRIKNLRKYGIISTKSAKRMQDIFSRYVEARKVAEQLKYNHLQLCNPEIANIDSSAFNKVKKELDNIKLEWSQFQKELLCDLPSVI
jgi:hypothetical protein